MLCSMKRIRLTEDEKAELESRHLDDYREGKLKNASGGSEGHLSEAQTQALMQHLEEHTYHYVHDIIAYIKSTWSVQYSVPGMNHWLHRNGFSYKKTERTST